MGGAYSAIADDVNGVLGQPAALANLADTELSVSYGRLFVGLSDDSHISNSSVLLGIPLKKYIGLGVGYQSLALNSVYSENTAILASGASMGYGIRAGVAAKMLTVAYGRDGYTDIDPVFIANGMSKSALDGDAGIVWQASPKTSFAYVRNNMLGANLGLAETATITPCDILSVGYREQDFACDIEDRQNNGENRTIIGIEKCLVNRLLALRLGLGWGDNEYRNVSAGFGINLLQFSVDYAFEYPMSGIEGTSGTHYLTIFTHFGAGKTQKLPDTPVLKKPVAPPVVVAAPPQAKPVLPVESVLPAELASPPVEPVIPAPVTPKPLPPQYGSSKLQLINMLQQFNLTVATSVTTTPVKKDTDVPEGLAPVCAPTKANKPEIKPAVHADAAPSKPCLPPLGAPSGKYTAIHKVVYGDTLPLLAQKYYGAKARWIDIYESNKDKIEKGSLQPGQILIIP